MKNTITWNDFEKLDIRVGTIIEVSDFPKARKPAWRLKIDFGTGVGIKQSSAQIRKYYSSDDLLGSQVLAVINFPPKQIADFMSGCLVLGVYDGNNDVILIQPRNPVANGQPVG
ncbi:MAG: tRNA-binding protein [Chitinophagaceae bacterium]|nr:MAG: tRNA-binding protein [Chitinophagaceae bacterium]